MITEISGESLHNLRFELRQMNTDLNSIFRAYNDNKPVETIRNLDNLKDRIEALLNNIGWYE